MSTRFFKPVLSASLLIVGIGAAHAEGLYGGASLGSPDYRNSINGIGGSGSGLSGKVFGGYEFSPYFGVEGGVFDLGHIDDASGKVNLRGAYVDGVGRYEFAPKWSALGSVGLAEGWFRTPYGNDHSPALKLGAGVQYDITQQVSVRAGYDHYAFTDAFDGKPRVGQYTLGVKFGY